MILIQRPLGIRIVSPRGLRVGAILAFALTLAILSAPASASAAPLVDSVSLVEHPDRYDGRIVVFEGEAIGDVMERFDGAWINVNDDAYSRQGRKRKLAGYNSGQSVLVADKRAAKKIVFLGDYNNRGDIVEVKGVFHKACPDHGGDMMIHSRTLKVLKRGFSLGHPITSRKVSLAITWLAISGVVLAVWRWRSTTIRR